MFKKRSIPLYHWYLVSYLIQYQYLVMVENSTAIKYLHD